MYIHSSVSVTFREVTLLSKSSLIIVVDDLVIEFWLTTVEEQEQKASHPAEMITSEFPCAGLIFWLSFFHTTQLKMCACVSGVIHFSFEMPQ